MKASHAILMCLITAAVTALVVKPTEMPVDIASPAPDTPFTTSRLDRLAAQLGRIESQLGLVAGTVTSQDAVHPVIIPVETGHQHLFDDEDQIARLLEMIRKDVKGLGDEQMDMISMILNRPAQQATHEREIIINNQKVVSDLVKDVQWEQTPVHEIVLGSLGDLDFDVRYGSDDAIQPVLKAFPTEIHYATASIKAAVRAWDRDTRESSQLLLSAGGIFHLHLTLEDFAKNGDDRSVRAFLDDILSRTHIVVYASEIKAVFKALEDSKTRYLVDRYKTQIRLRIGPHAAVLRGALTPSSCRAFVTELLRGRTFSGR